MFNSFPNSMTKLATLLVLTGMIVPLLAACGAGRTEITFVYMRTSNITESYWKEVIKDFEAQNPSIHVNLYVFTWDEGHDKIEEMVKQGRPPTLARVATRWVPEYVAAGLVEPMDPYLTPELKAEFIPVLINEGAQYQGRTFGLPVTVSARALYYNKDLFQRAGIGDPPRRWDELRAAALKISTLSNGIYGFGLQGNLVGTETYFYYFLWGNGGDVLSRDGTRAAFNSPQSVEALKYLQGLIEAGATQPEPAKDDRQALETGFVQGRLGMVITGPWLAKRLKTEAPNLNYGLAPIPFNTTPATLAGEDTLILFKPAEHKDIAWKFIQFIYQDRYRLDYALREGVLPEKTSVAARPEMTGDAAYAFFLELLPTGRFEPLNVESADIALNVIAALQSVYRREAEPQAALDAAAAKTNELLAYSATSW